MSKTKISEYSATANSNTDVGGINIDEGCAPSGINDAIRTLMAQLKNFQTGTGGDSFNGPIGTTTAAAGAFTTLSATGNVTLGDASTDTLNVGNGGLVKDASGNVGIGTASPAATNKVQVSQTSTTDGATAIAVTCSGATTGSNYGLYSSVSGASVKNWGLYVAAGESYLSGNVGVGVVPSAWSGYKVLQAGIGSFAGGSSGAYLIQDNLYTDNSGASWKYIANNYAAAQYYAAAGAHVWRTAPNAGGSQAGTAATLTQAMTLDASGNLILNNTSRIGSARFSMLITPASENGIAIKTSTNGNFTALRGINSGNNEGAAIDFNTDAGSIKLRTSNTDQVTLDSSGNLLVGTTSVFDSGRICSDGASSNIPLSLRVTPTTNSSQISFRNGNGVVGSINTNGTATSYVTSSDYRLKNTVTPMTGALAKVAMLKPVTYKWNVDDSDGEGFIAHELQEVVPQCVSGEKDAVDEDGNPLYQGIDTSFLVATLTAAIQEQQALITTLTARIEALEQA